ncbi:hypothetical protein B4U84_13150 [Westiellopsis prolifica IICB1]|nr:hypothetical protein B4U84_13150 [Westiellopsis prolifica IICB1]
MEGITSLTTLKQRLDQETQNGNLSLKTDNSASQHLTQFLATLPNQQIVLSNVSSTINDTAQILTIAGGADEDWLILGTANESLHIYQVSLIYTQVGGIFETILNVEGTLTVGRASLIVTGLLEGNNQIRCQIKQPQSVNTIGLIEIANFISHNYLAADLPTEVDLFTGQVPLTALDFSFGFSRSAATRFIFTSDLNASWKIVDKLASLERVGITLTSEHTFRSGAGFQSRVGGNIHAYLLIEQEFAVSLALQGQYNWEIGVIPADGNVLPGLATLADLIGGEALQKSVESGLKTLGLGAIAIDGVYLKVDLKAATLRSVAIHGHITVEEITFNIEAYLPNFEFHGRLSPNSPIHLKALINKYFIVTDTFPEIDINVLSIGAQPGIGKYSLYASIMSNWTLKIGDINLIFKEFDLQITKQIEGVTGSIGGVLELAGVELYTSAEYLEIGGGWEFYSSTEDNKEMPIGELIEKLVQLFGEVTLPTALVELKIINFHVSFNTNSKNFTFTCKSKFPIDTQEVDITVNINIIQQQDGSYKKHFDGYITIGSLKFALIFDTDQTSTTFLAAYHDEQTISVKELIGYIYPNLQNEIPEGLEISLKDALFAYSKQPTLTNFLFGLNIGSGINLSNLPLVGQEFPPNQTIKLSFQVLVSKSDFTTDEIKNLNKLYPEGGISLPQDQAITSRLSLATLMQLGNETQQLQLPVAINQTTGQLQTTTPNINAPSSQDTTQWFTLQKSFGSVHFERIGLNYKDSRIWVLLDAGFSLAGLSLSLDGLSVNSPLTTFEPQFDLKGLGIDYKGGDTLEIGGAFLRQQVTKNGITYDEYDGAAVIKFNVKGKALNLSAIGSYSYIEGHPSLFIYALLNYPIGGPSFFFVTGLAAGFGYNRALKVPTIEQVATFPLVAEAISPPQSSDSNLDKATQLTQELEKLREYIPPETGQIFLAVGVKFTSFKTIDSFVLLTVAFGNRFELNILGLSTLIAPPEAGATPVAEVQLALKASFLPEEGFLGISAQLTPNSYILSKACHLTGGFAFYSWFAPNEHEGDFVLTLGGYHPRFQVPEHYPTVPPLTLNWQVNDELQIKADAYFALTASAIMAGGHLQATWNSGSLSAWFNAGADFLMSWKPYHYDISIYIDMGVSYTFEFFGTQHITVELGADLHIWGPEFSGLAQIHLWIISFDVRFGSDASQAPTPIDWSTFKTSFLPANNDICSIAVKDGLVTKVNQNKKSDLGVINAKNFCLVTNSVIPAKKAVYQETQTSTASNIKTDGINAKFGVGSMGVSSDKLTSDLIINITRNEIAIKAEEFAEEFACTPILKKVPVGLWGESLTPDLNGAQFIENALSGLEIKPKEQHKAGKTHAIERTNLQFTTELINNAYKWGNIEAFKSIPFDDKKTEEENNNASKQIISESIVDNTVKTTRENLLRGLNLNIEEIDISKTIADDFFISPKIAELVK